MAFGATGCATVTRGTKTAWEVQTDPSGAKVETSHGHQCPSTPCSIKMARKSEFTATITKDGYEPAMVSVTHKVGGGGGAAMAGTCSSAASSGRAWTRPPAPCSISRLTPPS
jgi:hypothetical protein